MVVIVMGVAGSGKTTIGELLARRLGATFHDADDLHSARNREKMRRGIALNDEDRRPWLESVRRLIEQHLASDDDAVVACSALKQSYRDMIVVDPAAVRIVFLKGRQELLAQRLAHRKGHFFRNDLLRSQLDTLEEPHDAIVEDIERSPEVIVESICAKIRPAVT